MNLPIVSDKSPSSWGQWPAPSISMSSTDAAGALFFKFSTSRRAFAAGTRASSTPLIIKTRSRGM